MRLRLPGLLLAAALVFVSFGLGSHAQDASPLRIVDVVAYPSAGASMGAAYFTVRNTGARADRLVGVESVIARHTHLHETVTEGDMARMEARDAFEVPAGAELRLAPGGSHVMFMGLKQPLLVGDAFDLTLVFENAGRITVPVPVQPRP